MIQIVSADRGFDRGALENPGGFAWWYLDLLDDKGNGLVLIWSFGLPFLPGYSNIIAPTIPSARPSICVAVYKGFKERFYLLQEDLAGSAHVGQGSSEVTIGSSRFCIENKGGQASIAADIETSLPGSRHPLVGAVRAQGPLLRGIVDAPQSHVHTWSPILTAVEGHARLSEGSREVIDLRGRVYLDRNASSEPLPEIGIEQWRWGHLAFAERELIFYQLLPVTGARPQSFVLSVGADGQTLVRDTELLWSGDKQDLYGLKWHRRAQMFDPLNREVTVRFGPLVDHGPFYLRFFIEAVEPQSGQSGFGFAELVQPGRIDLRLMRPFIQMRIHRKHGPNSLMLPFFSGENRGRWRRYFSHVGDSIRSIGGKS